MGRLLEILEGYDLGEREAEDERVWLLNKENVFTVKSIYNVLTIGEPCYFRLASSGTTIFLPRYLF